MTRLPHAGLTLTVALALAGCGEPTAETVEQPPVPVETVQVDAAGAAEQSRGYPVVVSRDRESALGARVGGILEAVPARPGDTLRRGSVVARLEATPYAAARARAAAEHDRLRAATARNRELLAIGAISEAQLEESVAGLRAAQAALAAADYDLRSTAVTMPFSGTVLAVTAEAGEVVASGQPIVRVADTGSPLLARARVAQAMAAGLRPGQIARVLFPGGIGAFDAPILRIGRASDPRTAAVDVDLMLPATARLVSGTVGSVRFPAAATGRRSGEWAVPPEALLDIEKGVGHVFVVEPRTQTAKRVRIDVLEISAETMRLCCLPPGTRIITSGAGFVNDGQRIVVTPP